MFEFALLLMFLNAYFLITTLTRIFDICMQYSQQLVCVSSQDISGAIALSGGIPNQKGAKPIKSLQLAQIVAFDLMNIKLFVSYIIYCARLNANFEMRFDAVLDHRSLV